MATQCDVFDTDASLFVPSSKHSMPIPDTILASPAFTLHIHLVNKDCWQMVQLHPGMTVAHARDVCLRECKVPRLVNAAASVFGSPAQSSFAKTRQKSQIFSQRKASIAGSLSNSPSLASFPDLALSVTHDSAESSAQDDTLDHHQGSTMKDLGGWHNGWSLFHVARRHWLDDGKTLESYSIQPGELLQLQQRSHFINVPISKSHERYAEGYLDKLSSNKSQSRWKARWFVVRCNTLEYYKSRWDRDPLGVVELDQQQFTFINNATDLPAFLHDSVSDNHRWLAPMIIKMPKRMLVMRPLNPEDRVHWHNIFRSIHRETQTTLGRGMKRSAPLESRHRQLIVAHAFAAAMLIKPTTKLPDPPYNIDLDEVPTRTTRSSRSAPLSPDLATIAAHSSDSDEATQRLPLTLPTKSRRTSPKGTILTGPIEDEGVVLQLQYQERRERKRKEMLELRKVYGRDADLFADSDGDDRDDRDEREPSSLRSQLPLSPSSPSSSKSSPVISRRIPPIPQISHSHSVPPSPPFATFSTNTTEPKSNAEPSLPPHLKPPFNARSRLPSPPTSQGEEDEEDSNRPSARLRRDLLKSL